MNITSETIGRSFKWQSVRELSLRYSLFVAITSIMNYILSKKPSAPAKKLTIVDEDFKNLNFSSARFHRCQGQ